MGTKKVTITEKVFEQTKSLIDLGLKQKDICSITGLSAISVNRISKADTYKGFKAARKQQRLEYQAQRDARLKPDTKASDEPFEVPSVMGITQAAEAEYSRYELNIRLIEANERQAVALERLADAWESAPAKKGLFK